MRSCLLVFSLVSLMTLKVSASLPTSDWQSIDHPGVNAFFANLHTKEYLTVIKNQSTEKMNLANQNEAEIAHVLTLLRRVSLQPFGITGWTASSVKKSLYKNLQVVEVRGTYLNQSKSEVQFFEKMYFSTDIFTQFSWIQTAGNSSPSKARLESYFQNLEKDYL